MGVTILVCFEPSVVVEGCCFQGRSIQGWVTEDTPLPSHCGIGALLVIVDQLQSEFYLPLGLDLFVGLRVDQVLRVPIEWVWLFLAVCTVELVGDFDGQGEAVWSEFDFILLQLEAISLDLKANLMGLVTLLQILSVEGDVHLFLHVIFEELTSGLVSGFLAQHGLQCWLMDKDM